MLGGYTQCKWDPLCKRVDVTLLATHSRRTLAEFDDLSARINHGLVAATAATVETAFPSEPAGFIALLLRLHGLIFADAIPQMAGRFRRCGEDVEVGREGHKIQGADADRIVEALSDLFVRTPIGHMGEMSPAEAAHRTGEFLEVFFHIHPFTDGNGRVGRLILQLAFRASGFHVKPWKTSGKWRRKYERGLEYAHVHCRTGRPNAYEHIARYIAHHIERVSADELLEAEPPDLAGA